MTGLFVRVEERAMNLLQEKVCLVTGASRGIGLATVKKFASEGAIVYANSRGTNIDEMCTHLSSEYQTPVKALYFDVKNEYEARNAMLQIKKDFGRLDVLVNNAGIMKDALIGMISTTVMQELFETNVFGVINMIQLACKLMKSKKSGSIINISSIVGIEGNPGQMVYSASKGAVAAITKTASKELISEGIRVNAIAPGMIDTDMFRSIGEDKIKSYLKDIRIGRLGTPEEVADAIVFLASDYSKYITGEILGVNGSVKL